MKRSPIQRKTPLPAPSAPLKRSALKAARSRIKPVSNKRAAEKDERAAVRMAVFSRDDRRCILARSHDLGPCWGDLSVHHLQKASALGPYTEPNLVTLCVGCNEAVESHPDAAHALGLVCRNGDSLDDCWQRMRAAGLVR